VGKKINANQIHSVMHPVYGGKCFTNQTVHVWCKKMLGGQKFVSYTEVQSVILFGMDSSQPRSLHQTFRSLLTDRTNV